MKSAKALPIYGSGQTEGRKDNAKTISLRLWRGIKTTLGRYILLIVQSGLVPLHMFEGRQVLVALPCSWYPVRHVYTAVWPVTERNTLPNNGPSTSPQTV
ncbi:hypothetical protein DPMN_075384 [Dreissena polymorpha]|uniref:Uncharacterized protein n=1 Tax=Dreissena polymorpha TaxID=45954 RepID=A0A9D3YLK1_DREPO|nr:hypothetical protein DPMN_075384 [Dreissena polymorpha]